MGTTANGKGINRPTREVPADPLLDKLKIFIIANLHAELAIEQLCTFLGASRSQLHNRIKKATGQSTSIYIRSIRLEEARKLIFSTHLNIAEIAYESWIYRP
jgi:AraC-like DNA-binding protein